MNERDHELIAARKACSLLTRDQMIEGKVPTTATSASIIAAMQVQEAVKLLHRDRLNTTFAGRGVAYNGITHDSYSVTYPRRDDCLSHDTYALDKAVASDARTLAELLEDARGRVDADAILDLEREIATYAQCACGNREAIFRPLPELTVGDAVCPDCGEERKIAFLHAVTAQDEDLLVRTPRELGLPVYDVITARSGLRRVHYLLDGPLGALSELATR